MTIEQYLQPFLKDTLALKLEDYNVSVVNDITYGNLENTNDIIFQIKTGVSQLSDVKDITEITTPVQINFKCFTNEVQNILSILNDYVIEVNTTIYNTLDQKYKIELLLTNPTIILNQFESFENGTKSVTYCVFTVTAYATDYDILHYDNYLKIDDIFVKIEGSTSIQEAITYNYTSTPTVSDLGQENYNGKTIGITINAVKTKTFGHYIETNKYNFGNKVVYFEKYKAGDLPKANSQNAKSKLPCVITNISETQVNSIPTLVISLKGIELYG